MIQQYASCCAFLPLAICPSPVLPAYISILTSFRPRILKPNPHLPQISTPNIINPPLYSPRLFMLWAVVHRPNINVCHRFPSPRLPQPPEICLPLTLLPPRHWPRRCRQPYLPRFSSLLRSHPNSHKLQQPHHQPRSPLQFAAQRSK